MKVSNLKLFSVAVGAFCMTFCGGIAHYSTTFFTAAVTEYLNCSVTSFTVYFSLVTACSALLSPIVGPLAQKIGARKTSIAGCIVGAIGYLILSRLEALWMAYLAALFIGAAYSLSMVPAVGIINAWFSKSSSTVIGIAMSGTGFSSVVMSMFLPSVIANNGWRNGYLVCVALWICCALSACILACGKPPVQDEIALGEKAASVRADKKDSSYKELLRAPSFWVLLVCAAFSVGTTMINQHMSVHLTAQGMNMGMVSLIISCMSLMLCICKIGEGILYTHLPEKYFVPAIFLSGVVCYLGLSSTNTAALVLAILCYGTCGAACNVLYPIILRRLYGTKTGSAAWGLVFSMFSVGQTLWTPFYARIYDTTGSFIPSLYVAAICNLFIAIFISTRLAQKRKLEALASGAVHPK